MHCDARATTNVGTDGTYNGRNVNNAMFFDKEFQDVLANAAQLDLNFSDNQDDSGSNTIDFGLNKKTFTKEEGSEVIMIMKACCKSTEKLMFSPPFVLTIQNPLNCFGVAISAL